MSKVDDILAQIELTSVIPPDIRLKSISRDKFRANCPIQEHRSGLTFAVARHPDGHQVFTCWACGIRGSVIDLYAAMNRITLASAIAKLSEKDVVPLSRDAILTRAYDSIERQRAGFGILACDMSGCFTTRPVDSELDFAILRAGSSWLWKVSRNGNNATCYKHGD